MNNSYRLSSLGIQLDLDIFRSVACAQCLLYIFLAQPPYNYTEKNICNDGIILCNPKMDDCNCESITQLKYNIPRFSTNRKNVISISQMPIVVTLPENFEQTVEECCLAAKDCCDNRLRFDNDVLGFCPSTWDGWSCFERSKPGILHKTCPDYVFGQRWYQKNNENVVTKACNSDGKWDGILQNEDSFREWTNYKQCHREEIWLRPMLIATFVAYCVSAIALFPALVIISTNRRLKNYSIFSIHRQLLLSVFLSSTIYIVNALLFLPLFKLRADLFLQNHFICRLLFILQYAYLRLSSFAWMLVEGLHLYWLLFQSTAQMPELSNQILIFTWLIPLLITIPYAILLEIYENGTCMAETKNTLIGALITIPCAVCLFINMAILGATLRLLLQKLRSNNQTCSNLQNYKKILRALIVLIPLFGVNLISDIYSTETDWHDILNMFLNAINGILVSLVVCYANRTVIKFLLHSFKHFDINSEFGLIRLSVSDYFRSHSIGCHETERSKQTNSIRFASI